MMRVALTFLTILGFGLPWAFQTAMLHGIADLELVQVGAASFLSFLYVSSAISCCFLILLYGEEPADGWENLAAPQDRITPWNVALLYLYRGICYLHFLMSIAQFIPAPARVAYNLLPCLLIFPAHHIL